MALDLPEIRGLLAIYLDSSQLAAAAAVCKSWNASFTPALYSQIEWSAGGTAPSNAAILRNGSHVRTLYLFMEPSQFPVEACTHIEVVHLQFNVQDVATWSRLATLIQHNPRLCELHTFMHGIEFTTEFMQALSSCPGLRNLHISFGTFNDTTTALLLDTSVHLEHLTLNGVKLAHHGALDLWEQFPVLQTLELDIESDMTWHHQLQWIQKSPQLRSISWYFYGSEKFPTKELCELFSTTCPLIESIQFEQGSLPDRDVAWILDACPRVTSFCVFESGFGPLAIQACARHFSTLTKLDIRRCPNATSAMTQRIMTSCPHLTYLCASTLEARDILGTTDGTQQIQSGDSGHGTTATAFPRQQNWVCLNLRFLTLYICGLENKPKEWQPQVLRQLARLEELDFLTIGPCDFALDGSRDGIDLKLESGLDILSSLKKLDRFCFDGQIQEMDEADVQWMVDAWPALERVEGKVHPIYARRSELQQILIKRGIALVQYSDDEDEDDADDDDQGAEGDTTAAEMVVG